MKPTAQKKKTSSQQPSSRQPGPGIKRAIANAIQYLSDAPFIAIIPIYIDGDYELHREINLN